MTKPYKWLLAAVILVYLIQVINIIQNINGDNYPIIRYLLSILTLGLIFISVRKIDKNLLFMERGWRWLIIIFLIWNIIIVVRGIPTILEGEKNHLYLKRFLSFEALLYTFPFFILITPDKLFIKRLLKLCLYLSLFYLIITLPFIKYFTSNMRNGAEGFVRIFASSAALLLLTRHYHSRKIRVISLITILLAILLVSILARRNQVLYLGSVLIFSFLPPLFYSTDLIKRNRKNYILESVFLFLIIGFFVYVNGSRFEFLRERINTGMASREVIINEFTEDFNSKPSSWLWGRGMNGEFKASSLATNIEAGTREGIENGYLNHILKGGILYLFLLLIIGIKAIWLGFFRSSNILCKAFASLIILYFIDMIGFGLPSLTLKYILVWLSVGACFSENIRNCSDNELKFTIGLR